MFKIVKDPDFKINLKEKLDNAIAWCDDHKWLLTIGAYVITTSLYFGAKHLSRDAARTDANYKDTHIYDASMGHYWELRRKLTNREWCEIERRLNAGEKYGDILSSMKVLK